jgi:hypothetical protein
MKLYLIKHNWRGERYIQIEDGTALLAFTSVEEADEHIDWETEHWTGRDWENKGPRSKLFQIVEIDVPDVRGIDP